MCRHIHNCNGRIKRAAGRLGADFFKDLVRPQSFHRKRLRKDFGDRLDREGIVHVSLGENLVVSGDDRNAKQLGIHLRKIGNVIGVLPIGFVLEFVVSLLNNGSHEFASGQPRAPRSRLARAGIGSNRRRL